MLRRGSCFSFVSERWTNRSTAIFRALIPLVDQPDGEHLVIDDASNQLAHALQQLVGIQNGGDSRLISFSTCSVCA